MPRGSRQINMGELFMTFLLIIVALSLTGTVSESVISVTGVGANNLTGAARSLALLVNVFWVILILSIGIAAIYYQFKELK